MKMTTGQLSIICITVFLCVSMIAVVLETVTTTSCTP